MRSHRKLMTPLGVLGVLAASAVIQFGAGTGVPAATVDPLLGDITGIVDTIVDQLPTNPEEMHW